APFLFNYKRYESEAGNNSDSYLSFSEPVISSMYDVGIADFFSMGLAVSYHKFGLDFWEYKWDTSSTGNYVVEDFTETRTLLNIGVRPLFHFGGNENLDFYAGARLGYSQWTYKETTSNPDYDPENSKNSPISVQVLFGFRAYLSDVFGIHIETAVGTPYLITLGWNLKF
ncbi:MAG: hypothetical protein ABII90_04720, partial [Bacteroidota bacterium]